MMLVQFLLSASAVPRSASVSAAFNASAAGEHRRIRVFLEPGGEGDVRPDSAGLVASAEAIAALSVVSPPDRFPSRPPPTAGYGTLGHALHRRRRKPTLPPWPPAPGSRGRPSAPVGNLGRKYLEVARCNEVR